MSAERVLDEWRKIASVNLFDFLVVDEAGMPVLDKNGRLQVDVKKLKPEHCAAIAEISADGKIKFIAKDGVLRDLARYHGLFAKDAPKIDLHVTLEQLIVQSYKADDEKE